MPLLFDAWDNNLNMMQNEVSRLLDYLARSKPPAGRFSPSIWQPSIDMYETEAEFVIIVDMAGVEEDDIEIFVDQKIFTIRGERRKEQRAGKKKTYYQMEIASGRFERSVALPANVDNTRINALYENGFVEVTLPKVKARQNLNIKIKTDNQRK
jgi:HSP20 family protein